MKNFITTGKLYKLFTSSDKDTIIRMRNLRAFIKANNIEYQRISEMYLINLDDFMEKVNPKKIDKTYQIPKLRTIKSATKEFNNTHKVQISYHLIERIVASGSVSYYVTKRLYLINYIELEQEIIKILKDKGIFVE